MKLESQVTSLELSKHLKEIGVKQAIEKELNMSIEKLNDVLEKAREATIKDILDANFAFVEDCEPDCTPERHARHTGSWNHHIAMEKYLNSLLKSNTKK